MEAEYIAAGLVMQELVWLRHLFEELKIALADVVLYQDNSSCMQLIKDPKCVSKSKHIQLRYHFIQDLYTRGIMRVEYCKSNEMLADMCTKGQSLELFCMQRNAVGLRAIN